MDTANNTQMLLSGNDIRAMVGIVGDVAAHQGEHPEKKRLVMDSLCELIEADAWAWMLATKLKPGASPVFTSISSGGFEDGVFSKVLVAQEHPDFARLTEPLAKSVSENRQQITLRRIDYDPDDLYSNCESRSLWEAINFGPPMLCYRPVANSSISAVALYRRIGRKPFDNRKVKIAHILLEKVPWLHEQGWPWASASRVPELSPKLREVLNQLLDGRTRKEAADRLNIKENTFNEYAKKVYKFFDVHSHAELVNKFRVGD